MEHSLLILKDALKVNRLLLKRAVKDNNIQKILELKFHKQLINETIIELLSQEKMYAIR